MSNTVRGLNRHYAAIIGCAASFTAGAVITLAMRVTSKLITRAPFAFEDYTIGLATAIFIVIEGLMIRAVTVGRHSQHMNDGPDTVHTKLVYVYSVFYFVVIALSITSILLMYRRIFPKPHMRTATTVLLAITLGWWIASQTIEIGYPGLLPQTFPGNPEETTPFHLNYFNWWLSVGIIEQVIIIVAIFLPIREIYQLRLSTHKKFFLMIVFAISYICVGTGIARLAMLYRPNTPNLDISIGDIWVSSHISTAIMAANLPLCWPIVVRSQRIFRNLLGMRSRRHSDDHDQMDSWIINMEKGKSSGPSPPRLARVSEPTSEFENALEATALGPVTIDGEIRHESVAESMGATSSTAAAAAASNSTEREPHGSGEGLITETNNQDRYPGREPTVPPRLKLRPFSWRFKSDLFASRNWSIGRSKLSNQT